MLTKIKFYYNSKNGYRHYIGFYKSKNKLKFTTKGLSFIPNK